MRHPCLACTVKHLAEAAIWDIEFRMGYPKFKFYVIGSLSHAAMECEAVYHELAMVIREHRINWDADPIDYHVPYEQLANFVEQLLTVNPADYPVIPQECTDGIRRDQANNLVFQMDTRPA